MTEVASRLAAALADRYVIERELGQGGMATVFLAEDVRHRRKVAVKVVHPELAAVLGAERFLSEIHVTAALQHPHILPLFDSGSADGQLFYVMPYVEGETLRARLRRERQLPIEDAIRLSREIASALDYAHRNGVVHRDVKPENVLLHDGQAVVADFGIALAVTNAGGGRLTQTGLSLGTPQYMSPEQATGEREIDARSDIYSLGAVTYEMLTGEPPFSGPSAQAIIAKVITTDPGSLSARRRSIPSHVEDAVLVALEKVPADRFATAAEFADALREPGASRVSKTTRRAAAPAKNRRPSWQTAAVAFAALAVGVAGGWLATRGDAPVGQLAKFSLNIPHDHRIATVEPFAALSPDGRTLVYSAEGAGGIVRLFARELSDLVPRPLSGTDNGCCAVFSPDGQWLAFLDIASGGWKRIAPAGGAASMIPSATGNPAIIALRWSGQDEFIVTLVDGSLGRLEKDGSLEVLARPDTAAGEGSLDVQEVLPDGSIIAIGVVNPLLGNLLTFDANGKDRAVLAVGQTDFAAYSNGYLLWAQPGGALHAAEFDAGSRKITGAAHSLGVTVQQSRGGRPRVALAGQNALAYVPAQPLTLVRVSRNGTTTPFLEQPRSYHSPRVSPDGRRIALDFSEATRDVWLYDIGQNTLSRATFENNGHDPMWLPDGRRLLFASGKQNQTGVYRRNVDGSGEADSILVDGVQTTAHAVTPDGQLAVGVKLIPAGGNLGFADLVAIPLGGGPARPLFSTRYGEQYPALSPDGRWLAYVSDESNRLDVYVRAMSGEGGKVLVSQSGGVEPVWSRDGREIFFRSVGEESQLVAAAVTTSPAFRVLSRTPLFKVDDYEAAVPHANYDVMPDGQSFVMVRQGRLGEIAYLQNWVGMLRPPSESRR